MASDSSESTRMASDSESADGLSSTDGYNSDSASSLGADAEEKDAPADADVIEFARYLGMDPVADRDLLWIAQEALNAPLPSEWTEHEDSDGNQYFFNSNTNESAWEHPLDDYFRKLYAQRKKMRTDDPDDQMAALHDPVGPRQRVKQWVGTQGGAHGGALAGRQLLRYTTSASDTVLGKPSAAFSSVSDNTVGTQSTTSPEHGPTVWSRQSKRKGKRGSWQAGESGEAAETQALAWQLEAMELSGQQKTATAVCPQLAGEAHSSTKTAGEADRPRSNEAAVAAVADSPTLTLSEVFAFPGAAAMQQSQPQTQRQPVRLSKHRSMDGGVAFSKSWTAPSKAISRAEKREAEHAKQVRRDKLTAMLGLATADLGIVPRGAHSTEPTSTSNGGGGGATGVTATGPDLSGTSGNDTDDTS